jgi:predicted nucleotidyltransferase
MSAITNPPLSRERLLQIIQEELPLLSARYGVERIALFGSYARETPDHQSDIDLVVHLKRPLGLEFFGLAYYLEEKLGRPVDLITHDSLKHGAANPRRAQIATDIERLLLYV